MVMMIRKNPETGELRLTFALTATFIVEQRPERQGQVFASPNGSVWDSFGERLANGLLLL